MVNPIQTKFEAAAEPENIVFDTVFAERQGGGAVDVSDYPDELVPAGLVVGWDNSVSLYKPLKQFRLAKAIAAGDTTIEIKKGSGLKPGEFIAFGDKAVEATSVNYSNPDKDVVTATFGSAVSDNTIGYAAKSAAASGVTPAVRPEYLTGNSMAGGTVNNLVRLVNGANIRRSNVTIADEILAQLKTINAER